jgi:hypothetical protein
MQTRGSMANALRKPLAAFFALRNPDFDRGPRSALFEAFVGFLDELFQWVESNGQVSPNSRVFTQIGRAALGRLIIPDRNLVPITQQEDSKVSFRAFRRYIEMKVGW